MKEMNYTKGNSCEQNTHERVGTEYLLNKKQKKYDVWSLNESLDLTVLIGIEVNIMEIFQPWSIPAPTSYEK